MMIWTDFGFLIFLNFFLALPYFSLSIHKVLQGILFSFIFSASLVMNVQKIKFIFSVSQNIFLLKYFLFLLKFFCIRSVFSTTYISYFYSKNFIILDLHINISSFMIVNGTNRRILHFYGDILESFVSKILFDYPPQCLS